MKKALILDLDGTIAYTVVDIMAAINHALSFYGDARISEEECKGVVGNGLRKSLYRSFDIIGIDPSDEEREESYEKMISYYSAHPSDHTKPYPGITEFLKRVEGRGVRLSVLSNKADSLVIDVVGRVFPNVKFSAVHGFRDDYPPKPSKEPVLAIVNELGVKLEDVLLIGDSEVDWMTAKNSSIDSAIVTYGFRSRAKLEEAGVSPLFGSMEELEQAYFCRQK